MRGCLWTNNRIVRNASLYFFFQNIKILKTKTERNQDGGSRKERMNDDQMGHSIPSRKQDRHLSSPEPRQQL